MSWSHRWSVLCTGFVPIATFLVVGAAPSACSVPVEEEQVGVVRVALVEVPTDVRCIRITAAGSRTVTRSFDVSPGTSSELLMTGVPVGFVQFTGDAFLNGCAMLTPASFATWSSNTVDAVISSGQVTDIPLVMHRNARVHVSVDFQDDNPRCAEVGTACADPIHSCCAGLVCDDVTKACVPATCHDGLKNGTESDVDCGGLCRVCAAGQTCNVAGDCGTTPCTAGVCQAMVDLGTLGGRISAAHGINAPGDVVGEADTAAGERHAFLFTGGQMVDLGTLGGPFSVAEGINDVRQVVGFAFVNSSAQFGYPFIWEAGQMRNLGGLGASGGEAYAINELGQIVGESGGRPVIWNRGVIQELPMPAGASSGIAVAINNDGLIGGSVMIDANKHAAAWDHGVFTDLGTLGGTFSGAAQAVNDEGQVGGFAPTPDENTHAFVWQAGVMSDLGALELGGASYVTGATSGNRFVGYATVANRLSFHAVLFRRGAVIDLGTLAPNDTSTVSTANAINAGGDIVGFSSFGDMQPKPGHAVIWPGVGRAN